ncbi:hypothetical protein V7103_18020, partial [Neobacillus drentensis]|uniref:hypothetical protein n=1 Tax=Neobacillus drentensis TaxID=220684 RepID=UPI002FFE7842
EIAFILGFLVFSSYKSKIQSDAQLSNSNVSDKINIENANIYKIFYFLTSVLFLISQLLFYILGGIPLFSEKSKIEIYSSIGPVYKINLALTILMIYLVFCNYVYKYRKTTLIDGLIAFALILSLILNGGKSGLLNIVFISTLSTAYYYHINKEMYFLITEKMKKFNLIIISIALPVAMLVAAINTGDMSLLGGVKSLFFRVASFGDTFYMTTDYFLKFYKTKDYLSEGLFYIFGDVLRSLHLISLSEMPVPLGYQLMNNVYGTNFIGITGPNARHNLIAYLLFRPPFNFIFSFSLGLLLSFVRNFLFFRLPKNFIGGLIYVGLFISFYSVNTDITLSITSFTSLFAVTVPIFMLSLLIAKTK